MKDEDEILQKIKAKTLKINQGRLWINRYQQRASEFQQNRFFRNNDGWFYKQLDGSEEGEGIVILDAQEAKALWRDIWDQEKEHNKDRMWLREIKKDMAWVQISRENLKKILKKILNWRFPGPDGVRRFCLKNFTRWYKSLAYHLVNLMWQCFPGRRNTNVDD